MIFDNDTYDYNHDTTKCGECGTREFSYECPECGIKFCEACSGEGLCSYCNVFLVSAVGFAILTTMREEEIITETQLKTIDITLKVVSESIKKDYDTDKKIEEK